LKEITSSQDLIDNIPGTLIGLASGYLSKKIFTGGSGNIIRKLLGSILQFGITNVVAKNSDVIKSTGLAIFQHFLQKKVMNSKNRAI
jgi:F0F1-type ATP synthase assembly protein I